VQFAQTLFGLFHRVHNGLCILTEGEAGICKANVLPVSIKQPDTESFLQSFDLERERGLANVERASGYTKIQVFGERQETLQLSDSEIHQISSSN
jgi:hypothetical protein